ncbi:MAG: hypothetical protein RR290_00575 [Clostridia bacterium]
MSICPFMSKPDNIHSNINTLCPCINSCELYTGNECSFKLIAKSEYQLAKLLSKDNKNN